MRRWVKRGGNLVLTDKALHALGDLGVVPADAVQDINVYQPYANFQDFGHPMTEGLRRNAHQLVEAATLGYGIGTDASPMTVVDTGAWEGAGGHVIGTTTTLLTGEDPAIDRNLDDGGLTSVGELEVGEKGGRIRIVGGALPMPTETQDHRFGLRNYAPHVLGAVPDGERIQHDVKGSEEEKKRRKARARAGDGHERADLRARAVRRPDRRQVVADEHPRVAGEEPIGRALADEHAAEGRADGEVCAAPAGRATCPCRSRSPRRAASARGSAACRDTSRSSSGGTASRAGPADGQKRAVGGST